LETALFYFPSAVGTVFVIYKVTSLHWVATMLQNPGYTSGEEHFQIPFYWEQILKPALKAWHCCG